MPPFPRRTGRPRSRSSVCCCWTGAHLTCGASTWPPRPPALARQLPAVTARPEPWQDRLLALLDDLAPADAAETAVVIADALSEDSAHEAGRVARLHPGVPVFVLASGEADANEPIFGLLRPFPRTLLVDGDVPEDVWTRVARHWHECFRLQHPAVPGEPRTLTGRPWNELDEFIQQDNILQLRSIMTAVVSHGRRWVPGRSVTPGSFIELNETDLEEIAQAEHTRWYRRRLAAGWSPGGAARTRRAGRQRPRSRQPAGGPVDRAARR